MSQKKRRNSDHVRRRQMPGPDNEVIEAQLEELVSPVGLGVSAGRGLFSQLAGSTENQINFIPE